MVLSAAVARTLGASEFGLLYLLNSIANFAYVFVDWGHGPYVTREVALRPHRSGDMMGSVLAVRAGTATVMCALAVGVTWLFGYDLRTRTLAGVLILALMPQYLALSYGWVFRARERMEYDALIQVVLKFSTLMLALACLALGGRLVALIVIYSAGGSLTLVVAMTLYRRLGFPPLHVSRNTARELLRDGAPLMAISLAIAAQSYIDANILYALVPQTVLGWYAAAWTIAGTLVAPASIVGAAMYPRLARASADPADFRHALRTAFRPLLLLAVLGAVGTYLFADVAIGLVYGEQKFGPAADILRAFAPALMVIYVDMLFGYAIVSAGKAGQLAKAKVVAVIVTTLLEWLLISWFQARFANGGIGIVLAMACGELVMVGAAVVLIRHLLEGAMLVDVLRALAGGAATIALFRALPAITPFIGIPLCVLTFIALCGVVGLVRRADVEVLLAMFGRRSQLAPENKQG
jgi:O-antigen/teichoic acid export membrane protein